ncbi:MAG: DUF3999 family protein [Bacteroidota bacterium]
MKNRIFSVAGMLLIAFSMYAENGPNYAREISGIADAWHRIELPADLFRHATKDLRDLRIIGVTPGNDTIEAPYILKVERGKIESQQVAFSTINNSTREGKRYITFSLDNQTPINEVKLALGNTNFDWNITFEGSQDQKKWFTIEEDYRILNIETDQTKYNFTALHFEQTNYPYFRITFPVTEVDFKGASLNNLKTVEPGYETYSDFEVTKQTDNTKKQTEINLVFDKAVPVSYIKTTVSSEFDFYRPFTVEVLTDSVETPNGWLPQYKFVHAGILNSIEDPEFTFNSETTQKIKVTIRNHDNEPLDIEEIEIKGFNYNLIARFTKNGNYSLQYGNKNASIPNYDIVKFQDKIPEELTTLSLGEAQFVGTTEKEVSPLMASKIWIWGVLVIVVLVLGWFTMGMIKKEG